MNHSPPERLAVRASGRWGSRAVESQRRVQAGRPPLEVRERIEKVYAKQASTASIKHLRAASLWGLSPARTGYDGSFTGDENIDLLEAEYFMMRVRCDVAHSQQPRSDAREISTEFARDTRHLRSPERAIPLDPDRRLPEIWRRLDQVGLHTTEHAATASRSARFAAGRRVARRVLDPTWAIDEIVRRYIGLPEFADLPRKYKTAIRSAGRRARGQRHRVHRRQPSEHGRPGLWSVAACRPTDAWPAVVRGALEEVPECAR